MPTIKSARYLLVALAALLIVSGFLTACKQPKKGGGTFKALPASASGISFINKNTDSESFNILDYLYFYNGGGVASADFNNDGLPDLYFISNEGDNKLYLNKGGLKFEDITQKAGVAGTGSWKTGVTVVDINGDGLKDIYVCVVAGYKGFTGKNQLYINNGNLTFTESAAKYGLDFAGFSTQASFFDYDKDGDLDMLLVTSSVHDNNSYGDAAQRLQEDHNAGDHLYRNDNGVYKDVTRGSGIYSSAIGYGLGLSVGDLNNDGWDDIYISNDFFEQDYYYINQKDGTFKEQIKDAFGHTSLFSMGNTISDVNKDGHLDVISTDMLPEELKPLRSTISDDPVDSYNQQVASGYHYQYSKNCLQLNVGNGQKFVDISLYSGVSATDWTWSPIVQDFDMDGHKDIFFSNGIKKRLNDIDYLKYLNDPNVINEFKVNRFFDKEKINLMPDGRVHNYLYHGDASLRFDDVSADNDMSAVTMSSGAVSVDLDNDGDLELVANNMDEPASIYQNLTIENSKKAKPAYLKYGVKFTKLNPDGIGTRFFVRSKYQVDHQEIQTSTAFESTQGFDVQFTFMPNDKPTDMLVLWPDNSYQVVKNFNLNKKTIITYNKAETKPAADVAALIAQFIDGNKQFSTLPVNATVVDELQTFYTPDFDYYGLLPHAYLPHTTAVAVGDANNDGLDDIYVGSLADSAKYILAGNKAGGFTKVAVGGFESTKHYGATQAQWADVNGDGLQDLIVLSANNPLGPPEEVAEPRLYLNKGDFKFEYKPLPKTSAQFSNIFVYDFNGDGQPDIFLNGSISFRNYTQPPASVVMINEGNGNFVPAAKDAYGALTQIKFISSITASDIDHNGTQDIVVTAEWGPVQILLNKDKKLVKLSSVLADESGWWQSALVGDFDGDGKTDVLAGNWGINNKYNVNSKQPLYAYNSDLDKDGKNDLILSAYYKGKYYPFRPKNDIEQEIPYIKKEFLSYQKMADKTTGEIFDGKLDDNGKLEAKRFTSVFVNDILGAKNITELPYLYQQAPIRSMLALSGGTILVNGNFWGVVPYEGKYDALGLVTTRFDKRTRQFAKPEYWVNALLNSQEIIYLRPCKTAQGSGFIAATNDGKLLMIRP